MALLTYRRPSDLVAVLPLLVEQARAVSGPELTADVLVVDNDPAAGARTAVADAARAAEGAGIVVRYEHEPVPGIAAARNRALRAGTERDLLVYIDDDERPSPTWLPDLLQEQRRSAATAVVGPVVSTYDVEPSAWVRAGGFFQRRRMPTGSRLEVAATNNLLLDLHQVRRLDLAFDERLGLTGGEDTLFTRLLRARGGTMVWCDEAVVVDVVPAARVTRRWVLTRAFRYGISWSQVDLELSPSGPARVMRRLALVASAGARIGVGGARAALGTAVRSLEHQARGTRTFARGAGLLVGALGVRYAEYGRAPVPGTGLVRRRRAPETGRGRGGRPPRARAPRLPSRGR